jgi:serine protease Do
VNADWIPRLLLIPALAVLAHGQTSLQADYRCTGKELLKAFDPQREVLQVSSAFILDGRKEAGFGTVVSAQGHILVKASEYEALKEPVVIVDKTRYEQVRLLATDLRWDVSLIKVEAEGLVPVKYAPTVDVPLGTWVVTNGVSSRTARRALVGVISAKRRQVNPLGGLVMGVNLEEKEGKLLVKGTVPKSGAESSGMKEGDVLLSAGGAKPEKVENLVETLKGKHTGEMVPVQIQRGKETLDLQVKLMSKDELNLLQDEPAQVSRNDMMSGDFSRRRSDFPCVLQHSILGSSFSIGGPLLDLDGNCLGMNIARANRAESFAIPAEELEALTKQLMEKSATVAP